MGWLAALQQKQPLKNSHGISSKALALLAEDFKPLAALDQDLPGRLMRHIIDDDDDTVIADLTQRLAQEAQDFQTRLQAYQQALQNGQSTVPIPQHPSTYFHVHNLVQFICHITVLDLDFYERLTWLYFDRAYLATNQPNVAAWYSASSAPPLLERFHAILSDLNHAYTQNAKQPAALTVEHLENLFIQLGETPGIVGRLIYQADPDKWKSTAIAHGLVSLSGVADYTLNHPDILTSALQQPDHAHRLFTLQILQKAKVPLKEQIEALVTLAVGSAKTEREAATILLKQNAEDAIATVKAILETGKSSERHYAVKLLWDLQGEEAKPFLEEKLATEKAAKVRGAIEQLLTIPEEVAEHYEASTQLPPLATVELEAPLPPETLPILEAMIDLQKQSYKNELEETINRILKANLPKDKYPVLNSLNFCSDKVAEKLFQSFCQKLPTDADALRAQLSQYFWPKRKSTPLESLVESLNTITAKQKKLDYFYVHYRHQETFYRKALELFSHPDLQLIHAVRFLLLIDCVQIEGGGYRSSLFHGYGYTLLQQYYKHHPDCGGLRELGAVLEAVGISCDRIGESMLSSSSWDYNPFLDWDDERVWPYFAERVPMILTALNARQDPKIYAYLADAQYENALSVLAKFPHPPVELLPKLWDLALSGAKTYRATVQTCLNPVSDSQTQILAALQNTDREIRAAAAEWLADRGDSVAIEPLKTVLRKEKSEATKDIMLRALERLGASVDEFFDRKNLLAEAKKLLKKLPAGLDWFPFETLPTVRWQDTGKAVEPDILKSFIVQCVKQKQIDPSPILKRYVALWRAEDKAALGEFILTSWMTQDTLPLYSPEEADQKAQKEAQSTYQSYQNFKQQYPQSTYYNQTYEELYQAFLNDFLGKCKGSAIQEKGMLALAAVCCNASVVPSIHQYLKRWYGLRLAQGKVLLQVLSWIEDNAAIQLLISISNRFRTKGLQKYATELVDQLAERNGWTREELADRTIPTAGLDEQGQLILNYGSRQFTLQMDSNFNLELTNSEGKVIKSLPNPRQSDDEELVKAAKKQLSESRKQLKQVLSLQQARLYEAMCTQRSWRLEEWQLYLNQHPILRYYCQRLIWVAYEGDHLIATFRPLEDGSLTNAEDEEVTLPPTATIQLAHSCTVDDPSPWKTHFADYEVTPLLEQFRPINYQFPDGDTDIVELKDFEGHLLEAFQLRGLATKQGYTRGAAEDGGWFYSYRKPFSGLGVEAVINFSGNYLPEENRTVALESLSFEKIRPEQNNYSYYNTARMALKDVPPVLLSEAWQDMKAMAALGSGYDPDWQNKVEY